MSLNEQEKAQYMEMYDKYDQNNDGLAFTELVPLLREMGWTEDRYADSDLADRFLDADTDNSRVINKDEFIDMINSKSRTELNASNSAKIFKALDADGSGKVNAQEFKTMLSNSGNTATLEEIEQMIDAVDTGDDGCIDYKEFLAAFNL